MAATIAQVRALVADPPTVGGTEIFPDTHYQTIIDIEDNVYWAAATAANTLAAYFAKKADVEAGPVKIKLDHKFQHYKDLADQYSQRAREGGGSSGGTLGVGAGLPALTGTSYDDIDNNNADEDRYPSVFSRGMDDNPGSLDTEEETQ